MASGLLSSGLAQLLPIGRNESAGVLRTRPLPETCPHHQEATTGSAETRPFPAVLGGRLPILTAESLRFREVLS